MINQRVLYYGTDTPQPERIPLRAGPLTMVYENGDLRYIHYGEREVVRRIYAAARDRAWGTAPNALSDVRMDVRVDSFDVTYTCRNKLNDIDFVWQGHITGVRDGTIEFTFDGTARATFQRARLGFCVLHPMSAAGTRSRIEKADGSVVESAFAKRIAPQLVVDGIIKPVAPFDEMRAVSNEFAPGLSLRIAFEGEIFEMEDQRNWTDGSYKTYCTPLRLPFPVEVREGERVRQKITLTLLDTRARKPEPRSRKRGGVTFSVLNTPFSLPKIGMCITADGKVPSAKQIEQLKALKLAHLRVDLPLWEKSWPVKLKRAARDANALGVKLEIGLFVSDDAERELQTFAGVSSSPSLLRNARYLVFHRNEKIPNVRWLALARKHLGAKAVIFGGTNMFFTELNRGRPDAAAMKPLDGLCYSFNPQVHAFDNASLAESPEAQAETIRSYKAFAKGKPLAITAITLKSRWSLGDPGPEPSEKTSDFDPRQMSLFGAGWTIASLKNLAQAGGAASATYYETTGKRGVLDGAQVFPMYHVFADVAEFGGQGITTKTSEPLKVDGLLLRKGKRARVLLANLTGQVQTVTLRGLGPKAKVKTLNANNAERAMKQPEAWRAEPGIALGGNTVELPPYAIARIDS